MFSQSSPSIGANRRLVDKQHSFHQYCTKQMDASWVDEVIAEVRKEQAEQEKEAPSFVQKFLKSRMYTELLKKLQRESAGPEGVSPEAKRDILQKLQARFRVWLKRDETFTIEGTGDIEESYKEFVARHEHRDKPLPVAPGESKGESGEYY